MESRCIDSGGGVSYTRRNSWNDGFKDSEFPFAFVLYGLNVRNLSSVPLSSHTPPFLCCSTHTEFFMSISMPKAKMCWLLRSKSQPLSALHSRLKKESVRNGLLGESIRASGFGWISSSMALLFGKPRRRNPATFVLKEAFAVCLIANAFPIIFLYVESNPYLARCDGHSSTSGPA